MLKPEFNWLRPLYDLPYWSRVWIVQELVLAKGVLVRCGKKSIDFDLIYGLSLDWGSFEVSFDTGNYQKLKPQSRGWSTIQAIRGHRRRREAPLVAVNEMPRQDDIADLTKSLRSMPNSTAVKSQKTKPMASLNWFRNGKKVLRLTIVSPTGKYF
jgi:hypothetical protein